jgi:hypothetical protein
LKVALLAPHFGGIVVSSENTFNLIVTFGLLKLSQKLNDFIVLCQRINLGEVDIAESNFMIIFPETLIPFTISIPEGTKSLFMTIKKLTSINLSGLEHVGPMSMHKIILPVSKVQILGREDIHADSMAFFSISASTIDMSLCHICNLTKIKAIVTVQFSNPVLIDNDMGEFVKQ